MSVPSQPIRLFAFGNGWGIPFPTAAPFPLKLATWLRMTGLEHQIVVENNPGKGPKGKSPWIEDGDVRMGDGELIIRYLGAQYGVDPDAGLSPADRAVSLAWRRTFEEHYHQAFEHQLFFGRGGDERFAQLAATLPPVVRMIANLYACAFGFLGVTIYVEGDNPLFRHAASLGNLVAFTERMRARYFPETQH